MTKEEFQKLLKHRNERVIQEKIDEENRKSNLVAELKHELECLQPQMNKDIEILAVLRGNKIRFPQMNNCYDSHRFIADNINHNFGFHSGYNCDDGWSIGIEGGTRAGECEWNVFYEYKNTDITIRSVKALSWEKLPSMSCWDKRYIPLVKNFIKEYKKFHEEFHKWLSNNKELHKTR